jgi:putative transposase
VRRRGPRPLDELAEKWGKQYGAVIRLWESAWEQFIPFLDYDAEIRTVICSTNAIESLNARCRRAVKARGHFPTVMWNLSSAVKPVEMASAL